VPEARFGIEQRIRNENWNNLFDYSGLRDDQRNQIRYRSRAWATLPLGALEFNVGLNSETNQKIGTNNTVDEAVFDTLNLNVRRLFANGLSLKVGRQDLMRGEGLVLFEGTSGDGSRSTYFNAVDLAYAFGKSKIEAIGILDPRQDRFLPRINDQHKYLQDWDEQALGLYYTGNHLANTSIEAYFFHKKELHDRRAPADPQFQPDRRVETAGARVNQPLDSRWSVKAEVAAQWGVQHPDTPIRAWAAYGYFKRQSKSKGKPYILGGYYALSGNDPARPDRISGWDPLFSRWPKWGDLEMYSAVAENGVGYATNQKRWHVESGFAPATRLKWSFTYYKVDAFHPVGRNATLFGIGANRGNNLQTRLDFKLNDHMRGHVDFQTLLPGDFYAHRDAAYFLRFEMIADATTNLKKLRHLFESEHETNQRGLSK